METYGTKTAQLIAVLLDVNSGEPDNVFCRFETCALLVVAFSARTDSISRPPSNPGRLGGSAGKPFGVR
jgi:hypothetical protein